MSLGPQQFRLLFPLGAATALSLTGDQTLYAVLPNQLGVMGITLGVVGVLLGVNRLIRIPGNIVAGTLNDRLGRRRLYLLGLLLGALSTASYSVVDGFWPLLAGRLLWGISWSLINVGGYTMILDWSASANRGRMTGFYQAAFLLGLAMSPILGGTLTDILGFRPALALCAGVSGLGLVVALLFLPETSVPSARNKAWGDRSGLRLGFAGLGRALRQMDRRLRTVAYIYLVTYFVNGGVLMSTISLYLRQRWGEQLALGGVVLGTASLAGIILALRASLGVVAGPLAGAISDRLGDRWPVVRAALFLGSAGFAALAMAASAWAIPLAVAAVAVSAGALVAALSALVGDLADRNRAGVAMGSLATAGDLGSAIGPLLAYALAPTLGLPGMYLLCAIAMASALVVALARFGPD